MKLTSSPLILRPRHAFNIAREKSRDRRDVWVRLIDEDGVEGWGEAAATPYYGETAETVAAVLPLLEAAVVTASGGDVFALDRIEAAVDGAIGRNHSAKAAVSAALHDLVGKRVGLPVWRLWGLDALSVPSSFTISLDEPDVVRERVREAAAYPILKIKVGGVRDEEMLRAIRKEAPDAIVRVDANTAWTLKEAIAALPMLAEHGVELIEQPLAPGDLEGLRILRERSPVPIVADESCRTLADVPRLVGAVDGINVKLAKCGSLREAIRMMHCARAHELRVMVGCMLESTLGVAAAVQLAPLADWVDLDGAALVENDPFDGPGIGADGMVRFSHEPGLGVTRVLDAA
jgi:L-alanine-DL-glutamate epimerase-like enolase superfamily enzyme